MNTSMLKIGFIGDIQGALASGLKSRSNVEPFSGSLQGLDSVILDGQSAASGPSSSVQTLKPILESGKALVLAHPSKLQLDAVRAVTGSTPGTPAAFIAYTKASGAAGYRCVLGPEGSVSSRVIVAEVRGASPSTTSDITPPLEESIVQTLQQSATDRSFVGDTNLIPPIGATWGYSSFQSPLSWTAGGPTLPTLNGRADDATARSNVQSPSGGALTEFYVYYVNGQTPAYYIVILKQTGSFTCGQNQLAQNENSRGWFQYDVLLTANNVADAQGRPFTSGVMLLGHAPATFPGPQVPVQLQVPMTLKANTSDGTGPVQFCATVNDLTSLPDWGVSDSSDVANLSTSWDFHEITAWDPTQDLPIPIDQYWTWWAKMYGAYDKVVQIPNLSCAPSNLSYEAVTAWRFDSSLVTKDPSSLVVTFKGGWRHDLAFMHNDAGCLGAAGTGKHHDLFLTSASWPWTCTLDLVQVVSQA